MLANRVTQFWAKRYFSTRAIIWPSHNHRLPFQTEAVYQRLQHHFKQNDPTQQLIKTKPRLSIIDQVLSRINTTTSGYFNNQANLLIGPSGIGKTTVLKKIQKLSFDLDPQLFIVYIDLAQSVNQLEEISPGAILTRIAQQKHITYDKDFSYNRIEPLLEKLEQARLRVALFYDDSEKLYQQNCSAGHKFINDLQVIANTSYSNIYTLLCSSSSALPLLVNNTAKSDYVLAGRFELQTSDLDETKFSPIRIAAPPNLSDVIETIKAYIPKLAKYETKQLARLLFFWFGSSLHHNCFLLETIRLKPENLAEILDSYVGIANLGFIDDTVGGLKQEFNQLLLNSLLENLVEANQDLLSTFPPPDQTTNLLSAVIDAEWEPILQPVNFNSLPAEITTNVPIGNLIDLIDRGKLIEFYNLIYPVSLAQLYHYYWRFKRDDEEIILKDMMAIFNRLN